MGRYDVVRTQLLGQDVVKVGRRAPSPNTFSPSPSLSPPPSLSRFHSLSLSHSLSCALACLRRPISPPELALISPLISPPNLAASVALWLSGGRMCLGHVLPRDRRGARAARSVALRRDCRPVLSSWARLELEQRDNARARGRDWSSINEMRLELVGEIVVQLLVPKAARLHRAIGLLRDGYDGGSSFLLPAGV